MSTDQPTKDLASEADALAKVNAREALYEAWVDDVRAKLAINRAVYASGYGLDPRPYAAAQPAPIAAGTPTPTPQPVERVPTWAKAALIGAALLTGGTGTAGILSLLQAQTETPAIEPIKGQIRFWVEDQKLSISPKSSAEAEFSDRAER